MFYSEYSKTIKIYVAECCAVWPGFSCLDDRVG